MAENIIVDITLDNFNQVVLEGSFNKPVLIDFWADWCEPCKTLTPLLEKIITSYQGELVLAKIDCDAQSQLVAQFGVRNLPTLVLFKEGKPIDGLAGNQTESAIRDMLGKYLTPPVIEGDDIFEKAKECYKEGQVTEAEKLLKGLLSTDNSQADALILYARCLAQKGELTESEAILASVTEESYQPAVAVARLQLMFLKQAKELADLPSLEAALAANPDHDELSYQLAIQLLAHQQYEQAIELLFNLFKRNRGYQHDLPRQTLVQVFDLLGNDDPLTTTYRRKLYQALY